jgi:glycosyltransferase involved in cell wall biosynthesis
MLDQKYESNQMNDSPLVSVICTVYNHENYLAQTLESFLYQITSFKFEIIVHDDASSDKSVQILKKYKEKYPDIFNVIFQKENQYSKKEKNIWTDIMFPLAKGKYIAICEGDDYWIDPFKLQKQVDVLEKNLDISLCFHNAFIEHLDQPGKVSSYPINSIETIFKTKDLFSKRWFIPTASIIFRSDKLPKNYPDWAKKSLAGDMALLLLLSKEGYMYGIKSFMSVYRLGTPSSITTIYKKNSLMLLKKFVLMLEESNNSTFNKIYTKEVNIRKIRFFLSVIKYYMKIIFHIK